MSANVYPFEAGRELTAAALNAALADKPITADGSTTSRRAGERAADVGNVRDYGALGDGVVDDTEALLAAIAATGAGELYWPKGVYKFSATLSRPYGQRWVGASNAQGGGTTLSWTGGNNVDLVTTDIAAYEGGMENFNINTGSATGVNALRLRNAQNAHYNNFYIDCMGGAGNTALVLEGGADGVSGNCAHNRFYNFIGRHTAVGVVFAGQQTGGAATDNSFYGLDVSSQFGLDGWIGIDFQRWCDSNMFFYTRLTLQGPNAIAVLCNSLEPTGLTSVYDEQFYGLLIDNVGTVINATGFKLNACTGIKAAGVFWSPAPYTTGTAIDAHPSNAKSFCIESTNSDVLAGVSVMQRYERSIVNGDLLNPNGRPVRAGNYYRTPTSTAPAGAAIAVAGTLYATPIEIGNTSVVKTLSFNVTTASGSNWHVRMGIYRDSGFFTPVSLITDTATEEITVASGFTGVKTSSVFAGGAGVTLERGRYWLVFTADTTAASVSSVGGTAGAHPLGAMINGGSTLATMFTQQVGCYMAAARSYGALPEAFGGSTAYGLASFPCVVLGA